MATKQYRVISASDGDALDRTVTAALNDGWELQGGVTVVCESWENELQGTRDTAWTYFQAITKVEAEKPPEVGWICR